MGDGFRESMSWLHTWAGVMLGALLFAIFWMGTLSVFDREIDRWMMPMTRISEPPPSSPKTWLTAVQRNFDAEGARQWWFELPAPRRPVVEFWYHYADADWEGPFFLHPASGEPLPDAGTKAGNGFIFPFHFSLHLRWMDLGYWIVGLAAMAMLVLLISGVVIHRRIWIDFFTLRWQRKMPRSSLDLHNLTGVLALPFHVMITVSGLIIFMTIYFPQAPGLVYAEAEDPHAIFIEEAFGGYHREALGVPGPLPALHVLLAEAERQWGRGSASVIELWHPLDAASYVWISRSYADRVTMIRDRLSFDAGTGAILDRKEGAPPVMTTQRFLSGMHFIQFDHWPLRWLYFVLGLSGCVMIATGYIYWLETRRKRHVKLGLPGVRIVEGLTVGAVTGIVIATLAFFVVNRLLPLGVSFAGYERAALEIWTFYLVWLATFAHAWLRPGHAWQEQSWAIAGLAALAPLLNGITTGDHLIKTISEGYWPVAGMDLMLLLGAMLAFFAARGLRRGRAAVSVSAQKPGPGPEKQHV